MKKEKRRRIAIAIIAFILIFMMIVPTILSMTVYALPLDCAVAYEDESDDSDDSYSDDSYSDDSYSDESYSDDSYEDESYDDTSLEDEADDDLSESENAVDSSVENADQSNNKNTSEQNNASKTVADKSGQEVCAEGIYIENVDVSGMTRSQVQDVVDQKMKEYSADKINLYTELGSTSVTAGSMGLEYENTEIVDQALAINSKGNILQRYKANKYISDHGQLVLDLDMKVDAAKVKERVEAEKSVLNITPISVGIYLESDGTMTSTPSSQGVEISVEASVQRIIDYMDEVWHGGTGGVNMTDTILEPEEHKGDLSLVTDILGSGTTDYTGGATGRVHNVEYAASLIDGTIIDPGEVFDFTEIVGEQNEENGWMAAGSFEDGRAVDTYGGGICQVSTTLYLAVLEAELEVVERYPHSMEVTYVEPGLDAAISEGVKNFRFKNNTENPIYVNAIAEDGTLTFNINGHENRDPSTTFTIESRVIQTEDYTTTVSLDSSAEAGSVSYSGGQRGLVTEAWKTIYIDGVEQEEEQVNESIYEMLPLNYIIGTAGMDDSTLSALANAVQSGSSESALSIIGW